MELCTDNAAMIAACAYFRHTQLGQRDPFDLAPQPGLDLTPLALFPTREGGMLPSPCRGGAGGEVL
jgi:hypothetical protein